MVLVLPCKILNWVTERERCSVVAGLIAWMTGLTMWATSLSFVRRRWYEIFFGVHHLYIVFFLFWLYHASWTIHFFIVPCLLFVVDRFLRLVQSRQSVDVLSAKVLESGAIQLRIATNAQSSQGKYQLVEDTDHNHPCCSLLIIVAFMRFMVYNTDHAFVYYIDCYDRSLSCTEQLVPPLPEPVISDEATMALFQCYLHASGREAGAVDCDQAAGKVDHQLAEPAGEIGGSQRDHREPVPFLIQSRNRRAIWG